MIDDDIIKRDYETFVTRNAKMYNKTPEYIRQTPTAKEYLAYLIEREKDKIRKEAEDDD